MRIKEVVNALERFAPLPLQDGYDNAGLQIGLTDAEATGALLCLDVTEQMINEAISLGCNLIISHHPLIFHPLKSILPHDYVGKCVMLAVQNGIGIYAAHTNLDNVNGGVNYKIAEKIGLNNIRFLANEREIARQTSGSGVIGDLDEPQAESDFLRRIKKIFEVECVRHNRLTGRLISSVALCGGAGAFLLNDAIRQGADVFITGELRYHDYMAHNHQILMAEIGHYESEQYTKELLYNVLTNSCPGLNVYETKLNTNPINYL